MKNLNEKIYEMVETGIQGLQDVLLFAVDNMVNVGLERLLYNKEEESFNTLNFYATEVDTILQGVSMEIEKLLQATDPRATVYYFYDCLRGYAYIEICSFFVDKKIEMYESQNQ